MCVIQIRCDFTRNAVSWQKILVNAISRKNCRLTHSQKVGNTGWLQSKNPIIMHAAEFNSSSFLLSPSHRKLRSLSRQKTSNDCNRLQMQVMHVQISSRQVLRPAIERILTGYSFLNVDQEIPPYDDCTQIEICKKEKRVKKTSSSYSISTKMS